MEDYTPSYLEETKLPGPISESPPKRVP